MLYTLANKLLLNQPRAVLFFFLFFCLVTALVFVAAHICAELTLVGEVIVYADDVSLFLTETGTI